MNTFNSVLSGKIAIESCRFRLSNKYLLRDDMIGSFKFWDDVVLKSMLDKCEEIVQEYDTRHRVEQESWDSRLLRNTDYHVIDEVISQLRAWNNDLERLIPLLDQLSQRHKLQTELLTNSVASLFQIEPAAGHSEYEELRLMAVMKETVEQFYVFGDTLTQFDHQLDMHQIQSIRP
ncbi:MAG: hypothetical protein Q9214_006704, partial [Letrouitia sp. 1 TL-2023]